MAVALAGDGLTFQSGDEHFRVRFNHANALQCMPASSVTSRSNYLAIQPKISNVPQYSAISCPEIYPGIDWLLHTQGNSLEYDWTIAPHHDPSSINISVENARAISLTPEGEVLIE